MPEDIVGLLVSACLGALVGLIRQWSEQQEHAVEDEGGFAGLRTFTLMAVLGYASAVMGAGGRGIVFAIALLLVGAFLAAAQFRRGEGVQLGHTTFVACMLTFLVGGLVHGGQVRLAVAIAAGTMVVVGSKQVTHGWTRRFTAADVRSALQFAAVTGVILPVFPDRGYGPFEAFNPHSIWMMVVLISGLGFVGYLLMRLLGARAGIVATGLVGGLASSTATALAFSRKSRAEPAMGSDCALAVTLACTVMLGRVFVLLLAVNQDVAMRCLPALVMMAFPAVIFILWLWIGRRGRKEIETPSLSNPLGLWTSIQFALMYAGVTLLVKAAAHFQTEGGLLAVSFVSGLTDMDAIALSVGNQVGAGDVGLAPGTRAVVLGAVANTLVKCGMAVALGGGGFRRSIALVLGATAIAGLLGMWLAV
ncbi:MAG TPA: MgtC/SapB family protein [Verrucomicrobiae bacterium]|nr:MgtC/SapB family protein [Verrucomicrobiae bacterium]